MSVRSHIHLARNFIFTHGPRRHVNVPVQIDPVVIGARPHDIVVAPGIVQETRDARGEQKREDYENCKDNPRVQFHLKLATKFILTDPSVTHVLDP